MAANDKDRLDEWLDSALKQCGNIQPRPGLEGRIMTNLEGRNRLVVRRRWTLAFASIAMTCMLLTAVWHRQRSRDTGNNVARVSSPDTESAATRSKTSLPAPTKEKVVAVVRRHTRRTDGLATARAQKFPSPRPLTDRELALAAYAKSFPKEAERIAQEQEAFEQEMEQAQLEFQNRAQLPNQER